MSAASTGDVGLIGVHRTNGNTKSPWDWAEEVTDKIVSISPTVSPDLAMQARVFRETIRRVIAHNIEAALREERIFMANQAEMTGSHEIAAMLLARKVAGERNCHLS